MLVTQVQVVEKTVETLQQNKILRVIKKNHVMKCMDMFDEIAELNDDRKKFYEQFVKCMKLVIRENSVDDLEIAELLRFNTSKSGDDQISFKEYVDRMKEGQNDNYHITGESIAVVFPSSLREHLRKKGHEVLRVADPVDEYAVQQLKEFDGTKLKPTTKEGLDFGDQDEKKTLEELKIEPEPLRKLMKEALGDKVEEAIVNDRIVDSLCFLTMSEHSLSADMERIMKAQAPSDNSMHFASGNQQQLQAAQQERKGRKEKSEKVEGEEWETVVGRRRKEEKRERKRDRREKVGTQEGEEKGDSRVEKVVMDAEIQIFVKADGAKTVAMEVSLDAKVRDVVRRVLRSWSEDDQDMYVVSDGRVLKGRVGELWSPRREHSAGGQEVARRRKN